MSADPVREAAQALIDRYHAPSWKDGVPFVEFIQRLSTALAAPEGPAASLIAIRDAAERLVRCKGRYHSELNMISLAALFGVKLPLEGPAPEPAAWQWRKRIREGVNAGGFPSYVWTEWEALQAPYMDARSLAKSDPANYELRALYLVTEAPPPVEARQPTEPMFLVCAGGDAYSSEIVPQSKLDDAYLLTQWGTLADIDPEQRTATLEHFHDPDEWTYMDPLRGGKDRVAVEFSISFEDGWVRVVRLPDGARAALAAPAGAIQPLKCQICKGIIENCTGDDCDGTGEFQAHQVGAQVPSLPLDSAGGAASATAERCFDNGCAGCDDCIDEQDDPE